MKTFRSVLTFRNKESILAQDFFVLYKLGLVFVDITQFSEFEVDSQIINTFLNFLILEFPEHIRPLACKSRLRFQQVPKEQQNHQQNTSNCELDPFLQRGLALGFLQ